MGVLLDTIIDESSYIENVVESNPCELKSGDKSAHLLLNNVRNFFYGFQKKRELNQCK